MQNSLIHIAQRLNGIQVSPIERVKARGRELAAAGRDIVDFSVGEPNFPTPDNIQAAAIKAMQRGDTRYTAVDGTAELKAAVAQKFKVENGLEYKTNQVTIGAGAKQVIFNALAATVDPGDEVIIAAPYFALYPTMIGVCGGVPRIIACGENDNFKLRPEALEAAINQRTRWLFLNSPSNPSGAAYTVDELKAIAAVLKRHPHVLVLSDDIYEHILYDDLRFATIANVAPELFERTLTVNGVSKTYSMTGWRIGYGAGPVKLIQAMAAMQSQATSNPSSIGQAATIEALTGPQDIVVERKNKFQERRDLVVRLCNSVPQLHCSKPNGAFYAFPSCAGAIGKRDPQGKTIGNEVDFAMYLMDSEGVGVVPGGAFGAPGHFRISFATSTAQIEEGCARIARACGKLS